MKFAIMTVLMLMIALFVLHLPLTLMLVILTWVLLAMRPMAIALQEEPAQLELFIIMAEHLQIAVLMGEGKVVMPMLLEVKVERGQVMVFVFLELLAILPLMLVLFQVFIIQIVLLQAATAQQAQQSCVILQLQMLLLLLEAFAGKLIIMDWMMIA